MKYYNDMNFVLVHKYWHILQMLIKKRIHNQEG